MHDKKYAQLGTITDPTPFVEYLTFIIDKGTPEELQEAISNMYMIEKSIGQKDSSAQLSVSFGISDNGWNKVFDNIPKPKNLHSFIALENGDRKFPATDADIFIMIKSNRMDLNFQAAKYIRRTFLGHAILIDDVQGYKYLDSRDMIDFVDGTENPKDQERLDTVLVDDDIDIHNGGTYLIAQKYFDKGNLIPWDKEPVEYQEKVIGRTKLDNIELSDEEKPVWAHNAKSKVEQNGEEQKMFRQNRPFGNALQHGTMFVAFAADPNVIEISLKQMITADQDGYYDRLLDFVEAVTGNLFFFPSAQLIDQISED